MGGTGFESSLEEGNGAIEVSRRSGSWLEDRPKVERGVEAVKAEVLAVGREWVEAEAEGGSDSRGKMCGLTSAGVGATRAIGSA